MGEPLVDPRSGEVLVSAADGYGYVAPAEQGDFSGQQVGYPQGEGRGAVVPVQQGPLAYYQQSGLGEQIPPQQVQVGAPGPVLPVSEPQPSVADGAAGAFAPQYPQAFGAQPSAPVQPQYAPVSPQEDLRAPAGEAMSTAGAELAGSQESAPGGPVPPVSAPQGGQLSPIVYGVSPVSGATTWASLLGLGEVVDIDRAVASGRPLVLVVRTTETSMRACLDFLAVHQAAVPRITAVLVVPDAPGRVVRTVRHTIKILSGAHTVVSVPWVPVLRAVSLSHEISRDKALVRAVQKVSSALPVGGDVTGKKEKK